MGGGAGLMFASSYKITTERTRFAMPEIGVGLFPDVGFTHEIKKLPEGLGLYIMLTATNLNAADTAFCNLTNSTLNSNDFDEFYTDIKQLAWVDNHDENIKLLDSLINQKILNKHSEFSKKQNKRGTFNNSKFTKGDNLVTVVKNIFSYDTEDEWYAKGKQTIKNGSPTFAFNLASMPKLPN